MSPAFRVSAAARGLIIGAALVVLVGCSSTTGPSPSGNPSAGPTAVASPTLAPGSIEHATGATDVVLRFEEGGGFVAPGFLATEGPTFSLYGDGTAIFRDPAASPPDPVGHVVLQAPYQIVRLTEEQIQTLLHFAIGPGGLAVARAQYELPIADAPTATFTIDAGGTKKTVSVNGLGIDVRPGPDFLVLNQLAALKTRLQGFANEVVGEQPWSPDRYRGILTEDSFDPPVAWPWPSIKPAEFVQHNGPNAPPFPIRTMSPAEVALLGIAHLEGGVQGISLRGPDGKTYAFRLRPLLPDEPF